MKLANHSFVILLNSCHAHKPKLKYLPSTRNYGNMIILSKIISIIPLILGLKIFAKTNLRNIARPNFLVVFLQKQEDKFQKYTYMSSCVWAPFQVLS